MNTITFIQNQILLQVLMDKKVISEEICNYIKKQDPKVQNEIINSFIGVNNEYKI